MDREGGELARPGILDPKFQFGQHRPSATSALEFVFIYMSKIFHSIFLIEYTQNVVSPSTLFQRKTILKVLEKYSNFLIYFE